MPILVHTHPQPPGDFLDALRHTLPGEELITTLEGALQRPEQVEAVLLWRLSEGLVPRLPRLRFIAASAAGVDRIVSCPDLPVGLPVTRTVDPQQNAQIAQYVCGAILRQHRQQALYDAQQVQRAWRRHPVPPTDQAVVGLLGLGASGSVVAHALRALGYPVLGWSRSPRAVEGVRNFIGAQGLREMLPQCRFLVCLLPLTPDTTGLLDAQRLAWLPQGAYLVNVARGGHVVDDDLVAALRSGHLAGAALDVQSREPLPPDHPFWDAPGVTLTPHIASMPTPQAVAVQLAENLRRARSGQTLLNAVDRSRGY